MPGSWRHPAAVAMLLTVVTACGGLHAQNTSRNASSQSRLATNPSPLTAAAPSLGHLPAATSPRLTSAPSVACTGDVGSTDPVAVVTMHGQDNQVLRDYADESHPRTFCSFGAGVHAFAILDPHHVLASYGAATVVFELPSGKTFEIGGNGFVVAVAPDLSQALEFSYGDSPSLHDIWDNGDTVIQPYPVPPGRCGGGPWPGSFSRDSRYGVALWSQGPTDSLMNIVGNHKGVYAEVPPPGGWGDLGWPDMAIWSPVADKLYYTKQGSIWTWTASAGAAQLRSGLHWFYPSMSPDGQRFAYESFGPNFTNPTIHLMDPSTGADIAQIGNAPAVMPMFLNNDLLWFRTEGGGCGPAEMKPAVYDFRDKSLSGSIVD